MGFWCIIHVVPKNQATYPGRNSAFHAAKRELDIARTQQPELTLQNTDRHGNIIPGRSYDFGGGKIIRDDTLGHTFNDESSIGRHFNVSGSRIHILLELRGDNHELYI